MQVFAVARKPKFRRIKNIMRSFAAFIGLGDYFSSAFFLVAAFCFKCGNMDALGKSTTFSSPAKLFSVCVGSEFFFLAVADFMYLEPIFPPLASDIAARFRDFFKCFDIRADLRTSFMSNAKSSNWESGLHFLHSFSALLLFDSAVLRNPDEAVEDHSNICSGAMESAPKLEAVSLRRLSRDTTSIRSGFLDVEHSCSISSSAVIFDGVKTSEKVRIWLRRTIDMSSPVPS